MASSGWKSCHRLCTCAWRGRRLDVTLLSTRLNARARGVSHRSRAAAAALEQLERLRQSPPSSAQASPGSQSAASPPLCIHGGAGAAFSRIYEKGEWLCGEEAKSGLGSRRETTQEFCAFLEATLRKHRLRSVVDAGCGHWPSGYQRFCSWQDVDYCGVDVVPGVVEENAAHFRDAGLLRAYGLASARFVVGQAERPLPTADLLIVKDVLMHLPNAAIHQFIQNNLGPRYRKVMVVQNEVPRGVHLRTLIDIEPGQLLPFDISAPPFAAPFVEVFRWQSDEPKVVQLWERP